jgi:hypothetical protein
MLCILIDKMNFIFVFILLITIKNKKMKKLIFLSLILLCSNIINAQVTMGNKNTQITSNKNVKATTDPSKRVEFVKIINDEHPIDFIGTRELVFFGEGGFSAKYKITSIVIGDKPIPLVSDTLILDPNKYFEFLTKDYGKFIIKIQQSDNLNEGISMYLWVLKNQEQNILKK